MDVQETRTLRPLVAPPELGPVSEQAQIAKLARVQSVIDQAAQQDGWVDITLNDLGLDIPEAIALVSSEEWRDKYPIDSDGFGDPAADHPLPKRLLALMGKAVAKIEVSTAVQQTAAAAAAVTVSQAAENTSRWRAMGGFKTKLKAGAGKR